ADVKFKTSALTRVGCIAANNTALAPDQSGRPRVCSTRSKRHPHPRSEPLRSHRSRASSFQGTAARYAPESALAEARLVPEQASQNAATHLSPIAGTGAFAIGAQRRFRIVVRL